MEPELSERFNDGIVPPPELDGVPARLRRPAWQPDADQVEAARKRALRSAAILALLAVLCQAIYSFATGWRP